MEDLREIQEYEKMANVRSSQGIQNDHEEFLRDSEALIEQELKKTNPNYRGLSNEERVRKFPYSSTKDTLNDIEMEYDEEGRPIVVN